ncbi:D-glucuronyl C5-epimerase [Elysia marginata]|uniref:heparosan-N-sulfate-glucuronate 5-epimerase n=1 Tax=Elysia marginata TaxID=1093978 RepID=A0AAV4ETV6_9GAST|nr:D-glucuronyl C5-epimerase [Elysia marginata]
MCVRFQAALKMGLKTVGLTVLAAILIYSIKVSSVSESVLVRPFEVESQEDGSFLDELDFSLVYKGGQHRKRHSREEAREIPCLINGQTLISCRKFKRAGVFMPWDFIKDYFEGNDWPTPAVAISFYDPTTYSSLHFILVISLLTRLPTADEGVPLTTQWSEAGYHYPIQVAQYGLSHHAKSRLVGETGRLVLAGGEQVKDEGQPAWVLPKKRDGSSIGHSQDPQTGGNLVEFETSDSIAAPGIFLPIQGSKNFSCLSVDLKFRSNGSLSVLMLLANKARVRIHYIQSDTLITAERDGLNIYYGLGSQRQDQWIHLARDLPLDVIKGLKLSGEVDNSQRKVTLIKIIEVRLRGAGVLDNLELKTDVHRDQFFYSADWFVKHQDEKGGWPIPCPRKLIGTAVLQPGWYSAMGQGQALSVLARAFFMTGHRPYLEAAARGLQPFEVDSSQGGVKAVFFNRYVWYEEYPTQPSSFVLNGFIYSLLGVYDFKEVAQGSEKILAERIYQAGMASLKAMLMMYDSGVGTFYDLRHIVIGIEPNRARWDYHTTHIELLMQLANIDGDPLFTRTHKRWQRYMVGKWARHN